MLLLWKCSLIVFRRCAQNYDVFIVIRICSLMRSNHVWSMLFCPISLGGASEQWFVYLNFIIIPFFWCVFWWINFHCGSTKAIILSKSIFQKERFSYLLTHQWPYKFNKPQWPYHGLSERFFFLRNCTPGRQWPYHGLTDQVFLDLVWLMVVWSLADWVKNLIEKKNDPVSRTVIWSLAG